ncbi:MAG: outer membrane protein transport protein [Pseudomonadota bacterium]
MLFQRKWRRAALTSSIVMAMALRSGHARAGNDDQLSVGGEAAMYGGAVIATVSDGAAGYHNPAGLSQGQRTQLDASITAVGFRFYTTPDLLRASTGEHAGVTMMELVLMPTAGSFTRRLNDRVVVSFGIFSPRTQFLILQKGLHLTSPAPAGTDWLVAINSIVYTYLIGPSVAYQVNRRFAIGASLHLVYNFEDTSSHATGGEGDTGMVPPEQPFLTQSELFVRTTYGLQLGWGFQWQIDDDYRLGMSMQTPGLQVLTWRQTTQSFSASVPATSGGPLSLHQLATEEGFRAKFQAVLPLRASLGLARYFDWGRIELDAAYQSGLSGNDLGLARHAVVNGRAGVDYRLSSSVHLGAGLFTDLSGDTPTAFGLTKVNMFGGTIGMASGTEHRLAAGERARSLVFGSTLGLRYAYGSGQIGTLEVGPVEAGSAIASNVVTHLRIHEIMLNFGTALNF